MSTTTVQQNIIHGLGESVNVASSDMLAFALRWSNAAYRDVFSRYRFKALQIKSIFRTNAGQPTYQAPSAFMGFLTMKDETHDVLLQQVTPEELLRMDSTKSITDETFTSSFDTEVDLDNNGILQYSETVADDSDHTNVYTRDTDYTFDYTNGDITVLSTGSMSDATTYYIDYLYRADSKPTHFALEYDATNKKFVFRLYPCPDATYIFSLLYPAQPSALSGSVDPIWSQFEYCLERGGIYFGAIEFLDAQSRMEMKGLYEVAIQALIQMDQDLVPKNDQIPVRMRRSDYKDSSDYRTR